jgi:DNA-binding NtrC family response regulator
VDALEAWPSGQLNQFPPNLMAIILIVEDEDQVRVLAESYLREQGHQTVSAATAEEALAVFDVVERIDVLFTDIVLKGDVHAGLELAKKAVERHSGLRVLYATGQAVTDGMKAMMVPASAVLEKPYTVEQLQTSLSVHFGVGPNPSARK